MPVSLKKFSRRFVITFAVVAVVVIAVRAALPTLLTNYVNRVLSGIPDYQASIDDVDLHIWRGAYSVYGLQLGQRSGDKVIPVLKAPAIDLSIEWRALLHGALVGEVIANDPEINIIAGKAKEQGKSSGTLLDTVEQLFPVRINRFALNNAQLHFRNFEAEPDVDIYLDQVQLEARNLTNSERISDTLAATIQGTGRAMKSGQFKFDMKLDPLQQQPTFELAFELEGLKLPELNTFLRHYLAVVARDGEFGMYVESKAKDGQFRGYVKPMVRDLNILHIKEKKGIGDAIKGFFVKIIDAIFENKPKQQVASKIEFSGSFENPQVNVWDAVMSFLRNAFVRALDPGVEGSITPQQAERVRSGKTDPKTK